MKVISLCKNKKYNDWDVVAVLNDDFCQRAGWSEGNFYKPQELNDVEMNIEAADDSPVEVGWIYDGENYYPEAPLYRVKKDKLAELTNAKWAEIERGEIEYEGLHYATDTGSQGLIGNAATMYQLSEELPPFWKATDGILQSPTIEQLTAISKAMYGYMEERFSKELTLAVSVNAAESAEAVEAVIW
jgi:hypothetical protein